MTIPVSQLQFPQGPLICPIFYTIAVEGNFGVTVSLNIYVINLTTPGKAA
jgi:hypothetical protein